MNCTCGDPLTDIAVIKNRANKIRKELPTSNDEWVSLSDRMPYDGQDVLILLIEGTVLPSTYKLNGFYRYFDISNSDRITMSYYTGVVK